MMIDWTNRPAKAEYIRPIIWKSKPSFNSVLTLPSGPCEDLKYALHSGTITSSTSVTAVEWDLDTFLMMAKTLKGMFTNVQLIKGDLASTKPVTSFDLANLDYQGNVRKVDVLWIRNTLVPLLQPSANVFITAYPAIRGNEFCQDFINYMYVKHTCFMQSLAGWNFSQLTESAQRLAASLLVLSGLFMFEGFTFKFDCTQYSDNASMLLLSFTDVVPGCWSYDDDTLPEYYASLRKDIIDFIERAPVEKIEEIPISTGPVKTDSWRLSYRTISEELANVQTPKDIELVERKMKRAAAQGAIEGKDPVMVLAGFRAAATRIKMLKPLDFSSNYMIH